MTRNDPRCFPRIAILSGLMAAMAAWSPSDAQQRPTSEPPRMQLTAPGIVVQPPIGAPVVQPAGPDADGNAAAPTGCPFHDQQKLQLITS
jgi:hypothetical protein